MRLVNIIVGGSKWKEWCLDKFPLSQSRPKLHAQRELGATRKIPSPEVIKLQKVTVHTFPCVAMCVCDSKFASRQQVKTHLDFETKGKALPLDTWFRLGCSILGVHWTFLSFSQCQFWAGVFALRAGLPEAQKSRRLRLVTFLLEKEYFLLSISISGLPFPTRVKHSTKLHW